MGTTYQQLFVNGINKIIADLLGSSQPDKDPGLTAWSWFNATTGTEPTQVNTYVSGQINKGTVMTATYSPTSNWLNWSNALNAALGTATGKVAEWLATSYSAVAADVPTVPDDVINWTKQNLPTGTTVVVMANRSSSPAASR